jgi:hypothetical protein
MTLPDPRGARRARAILITFVSLALLPAFVPWTAPASPHEVSNMATKVAFRPGSGAALRSGGQFTRALTKNGLPGMFQDGLPEFWGSCGGTIAINTSSMSAGELNVVQDTAADFAATATGQWTITTTAATAGRGSVVVVMVDGGVDRDGEWGLAHYTTSFGMESTAPRLFMKISNATVHLSDGMAGGQSQPLVRAVMLHELGHIAGADHNTSDPQSVMAPRMDQAHLGYPVYTPAETAGIRKGGSHSCS